MPKVDLSYNVGEPKTMLGKLIALVGHFNLIRVWVTEKELEHHGSC